jgi:putative RNA 2'-phosphotransferase
MINEKDIIHLSKFLSLVLRHKPEEIGIVLDEQGWTDIDILIAKANEKGVKMDRDILRLVVESNSKKRFAFNETGQRIRASQGHSVEVELGYVRQEPPAILYHGTATKSVDSILKAGLEKRQRHHVHLSADVETAKNVGMRYGKPVIFEVSALQMHGDKFEFFLSQNGVWLTDHVPVRYLKNRE